jgi:hypothetical protein
MLIWLPWLHGSVPMVSMVAIIKSINVPLFIRTFARLPYIPTATNITTVSLVIEFTMVTLLTDLITLKKLRAD